MKPAKFVFETNCIECPGPDPGKAIRDMVDAAVSIQWKTFAAYCEWKPVAEFLGYEVGRKTGLHLKDDYAVSFHKSNFRGRPCFYFRWSAIEYIFTNPA